MYENASGVVGNAVNVWWKANVAERLIEEAVFTDWSELYRDPVKAVATIVSELQENDHGITNVLSVQSGEGFVASIEGLGLHRIPALLKRVFFLAGCAACGKLAHVPGAKLHAVRESEAGDAAQVERGDGAKLWRCMITKQGAGYRLQYWASISAIELHTVVVESKI